MQHFLVLAIAVFLDRLFEKPAKYDLVVWFLKVATFIDQTWHGQEELITIKDNKPNPAIQLIVKIKGILAVFFLVLPCLALTIYLETNQLGFFFDVLFLYLCLGGHNLKKDSLAIEIALSNNDIDQSRKALASLSHQDTSNMNLIDIVHRSIDLILQDGNSTIFAPIFWFMILGAPGAVLYRLVDSLAQIWDCKNPRYANFGLAASRINYVLNCVPVYFTAISYTLLGEMKSISQSLLKVISLWAKPNEQILSTAGSSALSIDAATTRIPDIMRAYNLVERSMVLWLAASLLLSFSH